jgi:hypothetical protein
MHLSLLHKEVCGSCITVVMRLGMERDGEAFRTVKRGCNFAAVLLWGEGLPGHQALKRVLEFQPDR